MRKFSIILVIMICSVALSQAFAKDRVVNLKSAFSIAQASIINQQGNNTITGHGIKKTLKGEKTCAGNDVVLIPATDYAQERLDMQYSGTENGFMTLGYLETEYKFVQDEPDYAKYQRRTTCGADGSFAFDHVADGDYFITTKIIWSDVVHKHKLETQPKEEGGGFITRVSVKGGETRDVRMGG